MGIKLKILVCTSSLLMVACNPASIEKTTIIYPAKKEYSRLEKSEIQAEIDHYWKEGKRFVDDGNLPQAYISFTKLLQLQPDHVALEELKKISAVADKYFRSCMQAYKKMEMLKAISLCDKVLAIEPEHELAKLYKARAKDIYYGGTRF